MDESLNDYSAWGAAIFVAAWFVPLIAARTRFLFTGLALAALMALAGAWLIAWWLAVTLLAFAAMLAIPLVICVWRDKAYLKNYPIFASPPFRTIAARDGFEYRLHIAAVKSGFGIGLDFDTIVDGAVSTQQTRWREVFPDRARAERELMRRLRDYISPDDMPDE